MKTIELSLESAKTMLPVVSAQVEQAELDYYAAESKLEELKKLESELRAKTTNSELPLTNGNGVRKRKPKGHGGNLIQSLLKSLPDGKGLSMGEIETKTGVNHTTVYRTLKNANRNKGRFIQGDDGLWRLAQNTS